MSNIIKNDDDLDYVIKFINNVYINGLEKKSLEELINYLIPKSNGKNLISYKLTEQNTLTALFEPLTKTIEISFDRLNNWLKNNIKDFEKHYQIGDTRMFYAYLALFVITHELEHSYQYLLAYGFIKGNKTMSLYYKYLENLFQKDKSLFPNTIKRYKKVVSLLLYKAQENQYILERNANIEALDLLCQCAIKMNRQDMFAIFNGMRNLFLKQGYYDSNKGNIEETYRNILMYKKYRKVKVDQSLDEDEKVRYGLPISEETRSKILKL